MRTVTGSSGSEHTEGDGGPSRELVGLTEEKR